MLDTPSIIQPLNGINLFGTSEAFRAVVAVRTVVPRPWRDMALALVGAGPDVIEVVLTGAHARGRQDERSSA